MRTPSQRLVSAPSRAGNFIMSAAADPAAPATQFSACSGFDFTVALQTHLPNCFAQPPGVACAAAPVATCRGAGRSRLTIRNAPDRTRDALGWRWGKGDATIAGDFGDPGDTTGYRLCVYDEVGGVPALAVDATVPRVRVGRAGRRAAGHTRAPVGPPPASDNWCCPWDRTARRRSCSSAKAASCRSSRRRRPTRSSRRTQRCASSCCRRMAAAGRAPSPPPT